MDINVETAEARIPQSEPLSDKQVRNNAGGFVFKIDDFAAMRRFVILGANANNYYVSRQDVDITGAECVMRLLVAGEGPRVVEEVTRISHEGRAPRQSAGIMVLAMCARLGDLATRRAALAALPAVCRTASTLFEFVQRCKELGEVATRPRNPGEAASLSAINEWVAAGRPAGKANWGRSMRRAVALWYLAKTPAAVAYQVTKYSQRNGWSHADLLRLAHPDPEQHAAKRRKLEAAAAEATAAAVAAPEAAGAGAEAPSAPGAMEVNGGADADWVMVPPSLADASEAEGEDGAGLAASEQGALAAAAATAAAESGGAADSAAAVLDRQVADMKAIFDFLTHGTLPGQPRPVRQRKAAAPPAPPAEAAAGEQQPSADNTTAPATDPANDDAAATNAITVANDTTDAPAPAKTTAADIIEALATVTTADVDITEALAPATDLATAANTPVEPAADAAAPSDAEAAPVSIADTPAATAADSAAAVDPSPAPEATPTATATATPLHPVMQYLVDANRLRKDIRAPPPLPKPKPAPTDASTAVAEPAGRGKRAKRPLRGRKAAAAAAAAAEAAAAAAAEAAAEEPTAAQTPAAESAAVQHEPQPLSEAEQAERAAREQAEREERERQHAAALSAAVAEALSLIRRHRFGHEHVGDTALLRIPEVWATFLEVGMPLTALIRNLGRMTELGVMQRPDCLSRVIGRLRDARALSAARVHPMTVLEAMCTYRNGRGARGVARWEPEPEVSSALEAAFYLAFKNVVPSGQRFLAGLDVSGSMGCHCAGMTSVTCREAAAAMLMSVVKTEPWLRTVAFSDKLVLFDLKATDKLEEVVERAAAIPMGGTDCALPILYATEHKLPVDVFVILTDNETWYGNVHPAEALRKYRAAMDLPKAKLVVLAFSTSSFSIADPDDPNMLDVAGLDSAVPKLVADFAAGRL